MGCGASSECGLRRSSIQLTAANRDGIFSPQTQTVKRKLKSLEPLSLRAIEENLFQPTHPPSSSSQHSSESREAVQSDLESVSSHGSFRTSSRKSPRKEKNGRRRRQSGIQSKGGTTGKVFAEDLKNREEIRLENAGIFGFVCGFDAPLSPADRYRSMEFLTNIMQQRSSTGDVCFFYSEDEKIGPLNLVSSKSPSEKESKLEKSSSGIDEPKVDSNEQSSIQEAEVTPQRKCCRKGALLKKGSCSPMEILARINSAKKEKQIAQMVSEQEKKARQKDSRPTSIEIPTDSHFKSEVGFFTPERSCEQEQTETGTAVETSPVSIPIRFDDDKENDSQSTRNDVRDHPKPFESSGKASVLTPKDMNSPASLTSCFRSQKSSKSQKRSHNISFGPFTDVRLIDLEKNVFEDMSIQAESQPKDVLSTLEKSNESITQRWNLTEVPGRPSLQRSVPPASPAARKRVSLHSLEDSVLEISSFFKSLTSN